jgi:hypothetical protein
MRMGHTFGLKVSIDETHEVQVLQRGYNLSCIEPSSIFRKALPRPALKCSKKFTSHAVLHAMIQIIIRLKRMVKGHYERVISSSQNLLFGQGALDLFPLNHLLLGKYYFHFLDKNCKLQRKNLRTLHGIELSRLLLPHEENFSNITPAKQLNLLEAGWTDFNLIEK